MTGILGIDVITSFIRMCNDGWLLGWHERNGGNLTYRMRDFEVNQCRPYFRCDNDWTPMNVHAKNLAGEHFISTGSGAFFRNVTLAPHESIGIVQINDSGDSYRIVWGFERGGKPTSEFSSHFLNHSVRCKATNGEERIIYHAHATALIAMTYIVPLDNRSFTRALWKSATECPVVFPQGVGVVPWMVPGGAAIAEASSKLMAEYNAIVWAHHGLFCSGPDFDTTFGLMHTIEKAADIYMHVLSTGKEILQTIADSDLTAIADEFRVELNKSFL